MRVRVHLLLGRAMLAFVAAAATGCGSQGSGTWPSTSLGQVSSGADPLVEPAIAIDADGQPVVACIEQGTLLVRKWNGAAWAQLGAGANSGGGAARSPALALDSTGLVVAWEDSATATHVVRAARFDGVAWTPLGAQINASGTAGRQPRLAAGGQGLLAAYSGGNPPAAVVTRWSGSAWQDWPATPSQNASAVELSLLPDGNPAVVWVRPSAQTGTVQWEVATRYWSAASTAWMSVPSVNFQYSPTASVAAGADGTMFLAVDAVGDAPAPVRQLLPGGSDWQLIGDPARATAAGGPMAFLPGTGVAVGFTLGPLGGGIALYSGTSWEQIASVGATAFSFAGAADGAVYVAWLVGQSLSAPSAVAVARFHRG